MIYAKNDIVALLRGMVVNYRSERYSVCHYSSISQKYHIRPNKRLHRPLSHKKIGRSHISRLAMNFRVIIVTGRIFFEPQGGEQPSENQFVISYYKSGHY